MRFGFHQLFKTRRHPARRGGRWPVIPAALAVGSVLLWSGFAGAESPGTGVFCPPDPLAFAPPALSNPVNVYVTDSYRSLKLNQSADYIVHLPSTPLSGGVSIWGGHNVVVIGGEIDINNPDGDRGLYLQDATGTEHVEGVYVTGNSAE